MLKGISDSASVPPSNKSENSTEIPIRRDNPPNDSHSKKESNGNLYLVDADKMVVEPPYEPSVNPFLFHVEESWKMRQMRHHYRSRRKHHHSLPHHDYPPVHPSSSTEKESLLEFENGVINKELPIDPTRPHFIDSSEEDADYDDKAFGDEDKDLREMYKVLFSNDY